MYRWDPVIDSRNHFVPVIEKVASNDRRDDANRKDRDQRSSSRPDRPEDAVEPAARKLCQFADRPLGFAEALADDLAQPGPVWIVRQSMHPPDVEWELLDEMRKLTDEEGHRHKDDERDERNRKSNDGKRGHSPVYA